MSHQDSAKLSCSAHSKFFDHLVELIPPKYYLTTDGNEHVNLKFMKKDEREEAKARFKKQHKQAKRAKLDPDAAKGTLQLQQLQGTAGAGDGSGSEDSDGSGTDRYTDSDSDDGQEAERGPQPKGAHRGPASGQLSLPSGAPPSRQQLQEKLQARLEAMRQQRKAEEVAANAKQAKQWRDGALDKGRKEATGKRKLEAMQEDKPRRGGKGAAEPTTAGAAAAQHRPQQQQRPNQQRQRPEGEELAFSKVDFGEEGRIGRKSRGKSSKAEMLEAAERRQQEAAALSGSKEGRGKLEREAWGTALARAHGEKVLDDPRLLRRSMKKEAKMKQKKAAAWQGRQDKQRQDQAARQTKRRDNLQARITGKKEKKKARRESKLLRAGFEGRKAGFIATPSSK